ncbi:MAG: hypothetical protein ACOX8N_00940 [Christensenellales bacterium]
MCVSSASAAPACGIVIAAANMDAVMAALDAGTREPAGSCFELLRFIYFVIQPEYGADGLNVPALCANACLL